MAEMMADYVVAQAENAPAAEGQPSAGGRRRLCVGQMQALQAAMRVPELGHAEALSFMRVLALQGQGEDSTRADVSWVEEIFDPPDAEHLAPCCPPPGGGFDPFTVEGGADAQTVALPTGITIAAGDDVLIVQHCATRTPPAQASVEIHDEDGRRVCGGLPGGLIPDTFIFSGWLGRGDIYRIRARPFQNPSTSPPTEPDTAC